MLHKRLTRKIKHYLKFKLDFFSSLIEKEERAKGKNICRHELVIQLTSNRISREKRRRRKGKLNFSLNAYLHTRSAFKSEKEIVRIFKRCPVLRYIDFPLCRIEKLLNNAASI